MRKDLKTIANIKDDLTKYKGQNVKMEVCLGRKKVVEFDAVITNIYPSVFTVSVPNSEQSERSYSYTEILCGNVKVNSQNFQSQI